MNNNILIGQSGGPTVAINATLASIISAAHGSPYVDKIYGAKNGIIGVINQSIYELIEISGTDLENLIQPPAMALQTVRKLWERCVKSSIIKASKWPQSLRKSGVVHGIHRRAGSPSNAALHRQS